MRKHLSIRKWVVLSALSMLFIGAGAFAQTGGSSQGQMDGSQGGPGESTGQYVDDSAITAKVKAALLADSKLKSTGISVETTQGVVRLTGTVDTEAQKTEAARVAKKVNGVRSVENELTVGRGSR
ncbi:MAG: BON domain-containing protein [Alphaproteobacteria bacterium]|nr:BON domain-containing protein [Alphaproteobacteria bacterium]